MISKSNTILASVVPVAALLGVPRVAAANPGSNTSGWGANVGAVQSDNSTVWCVPALVAGGATSSFQRVPSDATQPHQLLYTDAVAQQEVRVLCTPLIGPAVIETSTGWSLDRNGDTNLAVCPPGTVSTAAQCIIRGQVDGGSSTSLAYVYQGSACGTGIASISGPTNLLGELLYAPSTNYVDYSPVSGFPAPSGPLPHGPQTNGAAPGAPPYVGGADIGGMFLSGTPGASLDTVTLDFFFGDTFDRTPYTKNWGWRHGTLAWTSNLDLTALVSSASGLQSWYENPAAIPANQAASLVATPPAWTASEMSAIPGAGVAVTSASGDNYRFLWFFSVVNFGGGFPPSSPPFSVNWSSLAYSKNGGAWIRGDASPSAPTAPLWPASSNFGPGAIWYDRFNQMIYFFGVRPQLQGPAFGYNQFPFSGIRVARVPSTPSAILNPSQYQYWTGPLTGWLSDPGNYSVATPADEGGLFGPAADLIPGAIEPRSEISVAFDAYANVWTLMVVNLFDGGIRLYQSPAVTGPWTEVAFDTFALPNSGWGGSTPSPQTQKLYGPFMSDHMMANAGRDVYYTLSEFLPYYNVGEWHFSPSLSVAGPIGLCN